MQPRLKTFIIYSSKDKELRAELENHLQPLVDRQLLSVWSDKEIRPGEHWDAAIKRQLQGADIFLMLVSVDFYSSGYIREAEFKTALARLESGDAIIIPIIVRDCDWESFPVISELQVLPPEGKAVTDLDHWKSRDKAWATVIRRLRERIESLHTERQEAERKRQQSLVEQREREAAELHAREMEVQARLEGERRQQEQEAAERLAEQQRLSAAAELQRQRLEADRRSEEREASHGVAWQQACQENTPDAYLQYLAFWPEGQHAQEARQRINATRRPAPAPAHTISSNFNQGFEPPAAEGTAEKKRGGLPTYMWARIGGGAVLLVLIGLLINSVFKRDKPNSDLSSGASPSLSERAQKEKKANDTSRVVLHSTEPEKIEQGENKPDMETNKATTPSTVKQKPASPPARFNPSLGAVVGLLDGKWISGSIGVKALLEHGKIEVKRANSKDRSRIPSGQDIAEIINYPIRDDPSQFSSDANFTLGRYKIRAGFLLINFKDPNITDLMFEVLNRDSLALNLQSPGYPMGIAKLGAKHESKAIGNGEFKAQSGLAVSLPNCVQDCSCEVTGYKVILLKKRTDPFGKINVGARFNPDVQDIIQRAAPGDTYFFTDIKARCGEKKESVNAPSLYYQIR